ncbi:MAG: hypothetical protein WAK17_27460 [Candidatus Nitrosopolaris sp.]
MQLTILDIVDVEFEFVGLGESFNLIEEIITFGNNMTMNCPLCGTLMVWLNGSIMHDPPINYYQCRNDNIYVTKFQDGTYEIQYPKKNNKKFHRLRSLLGIQ